MMILTQDVQVMSTGLIRKAGKSVGESEVPPELWQQWLDEGILTDFSEDALVRAPSLDVRGERPALEKGDDEVVYADIPLEQLTQDRLREMAKDMGIGYSWTMKKPTLIKKIRAV